MASIFEALTGGGGAGGGGVGYGVSASSSAKSGAGIGNQGFNFGGINTGGAGGMPGWVWIAAALVGLYLISRR